MYTAQLQGFDIFQALDRDYIDMEEALIDDLAKEIAVRQHGLPSKEQLQDEDVALLAKTLAAVRVPSIAVLQKANSCVSNAVYEVVNKVGLNMSLALNMLIETDAPVKTKAHPFTEVDIQEELKKRPYLKNIGRLLMPTQEMVNSFSKELAEADTAFPPFSPYCARSPQDLPWRLDKLSHNRAWEDEKARQKRFGQTSPCLNSAQMVVYRLRVIVAGDLAGAWDKFGGFGAQLCLLSSHLEACIENNTEVMARLADEENEVLSHMARSRMDPKEVFSVISDPDRDRRLRVVDEQRRAYHLRSSQSQAAKRSRHGGGASSSNTQGNSREDQRDQPSKNARKKRYRKERVSDPPPSTPKSQSSK